MPESFLLNLILPAVSGAFGAGLVAATIKGRLSAHDRRLEVLESNKAIVMGATTGVPLFTVAAKCGDWRAECRSEWKDDIAKLEKEVKDGFSDVHEKAEKIRAEWKDDLANVQQEMRDGFERVESKAERIREETVSWLSMMASEEVREKIVRSQHDKSYR